MPGPGALRDAARAAAPRRRALSAVQEATHDRPLVPARAARARARDPRRPSPASARSAPWTPARRSSPRAPPTTTPAGSAAPRNEVQRGERESVVILGAGPNRIGQGIEFDYCCVHAAMTVRESGRDAVMINCNPETVSTDYDTSDRLYFEPLTLEDVLAVVEIERPLGVIVQFGGQTPLKLAAGLEQAAGVPLLGTSVEAIDLAEDRGALRRAARQARLQGAAVRERALGRAGAGPAPSRSASRCSCAPPTCSAAGRWRSSTRARTSPTTCAARPPQRRRRAASTSTASSRTRSRSTWTRSATGERGLDRRDHAARRGGRACTPATAPACCRRTRSARRCSSRSARPRARSRWRSASSGC